MSASACIVLNLRHLVLKVPEEAVWTDGLQGDVTIDQQQKKTK
jgi:hypothetical protein